MEKPNVSQEFTCKCGHQKGWITEDATLKHPCPYCGRIYKGVYNSKTFQVNAVETGRIREP